MTEPTPGVIPADDGPGDDDADLVRAIVQLDRQVREARDDRAAAEGVARATRIEAEFVRQEIDRLTAEVDRLTAEVDRLTNENDQLRDDLAQSEGKPS